MPAAAHLLHVASRPIVISEELWKKWYIDEHLADLVNSGVATRATFYEEVPTPFNLEPSNEQKFLALYQTDFEECMKSDNFSTLKPTSELFPLEGGEKEIGKNGDFDGRNYKLVQEYDPKDFGETIPPFIATVEIQPRAENDEDLDKWYREKHLDMVAKIPGYRRSLRYQLGPRTPMTKGEAVPQYLTVHEYDDIEATGGKEAQDANAVPWTQKHVKESEIFVARGWKLVHAQGF